MNNETWQLCPKCLGEGICDNIGLATSVKRQCPVCNGNKVIPSNRFWLQSEAKESMERELYEGLKELVQMYEFMSSPKRLSEPNIITNAATINGKDNDSSTVTGRALGSYGVNITVVVVDSCEYIVGEEWQKGISIVHKQNCKFCILRNRSK